MYYKYKTIILVSCTCVGLLIIFVYKIFVPFYNLGHSISGGHNSEYIDSKSVDSVNVSILKRPVTDHCTVPSVRVTPRERERDHSSSTLINYHFFAVGMSNHTAEHKWSIFFFNFLISKWSILLCLCSS